MNCRVVITGMGVRAPGAMGKDAFWELLSTGGRRPGASPSSTPRRTGPQVAAEVDFDPDADGLSPQEIRRMDRAAQFAVVRAREAVADSGLDLAAARPGPGRGRASAARSAHHSLEREYLVLSDGGRRWTGRPRVRCRRTCTTTWCPARWPPRSPGRSARRDRCAMVSDGCTSGLDAVGHAAELIREGSADVDGRRRHRRADLPDHGGLLRRDQGDHARNDDPEHASRPFDRTRNGFVLGEGAAVLVLEELEPRPRRGAHIYAEVAGFATRCNAYHMTGLRADGREMAEAIRPALDRGPARTRRRGLRQRPRLGHQAERPARDRRVQAQPRRARLPDAGQFDQVDGRPLARRRSARSRSPPARWPSSTAWCRRRRTCTSPIRSATWTTCR